MTKKKDKELKVKEVATNKIPGLFVSRITSEECEIRGTVFTIETIPKNVKRYAISKFKNLHSVNQISKTLELITLIFRLGCTSIVGLKDSDGDDVIVKREDIKIDGANRKIIPERITECLPDELISTLGARILTIDSLTDSELNKLDFTKNSENGKEAV